MTDSGAASASNAGVANSGVHIGDVKAERHEHHHYPRAAELVWPILVGQPPALASAFQPRQGVREQVMAARGHGDDVVLTQQTTGGDSRGTRVLAGGGGVGKSQLAAWFARQAIEDRTAELVLWVNATGSDQTITEYARAAAKAGVPGADGVDPAADAKAFLEWLHTTERSWLVVLDDVADPADVAGWWPPQRPAGWTLATTRLRDLTLISSGRQQIDIDVYTPSEAVAYLTDRLTGANNGHLLDEGAAELATAVGHLPLALSHAAAYMISQQEGCAAYLSRYTASEERLAELMPAGADPDAYGRSVAVTLLLALDAADTAEPVGLARPALTVAAVCDPAGHPDTLWTTTPITAYLAAHQSTSVRTPWLQRLRLRRRTRRPITADQAHRALRLLHRYGLLTHTPADGARAVRIHALTARAMRETVTNPAAVTHAAADALLTLWPDLDHATTDLIAALRANSTTLAGIAGDVFWHPDGHPLLYQAGKSLLNAGLHTAAIAYWQHLVEQAALLLGEEHPSTLAARANLGSSYWQAGRTTDAITILEQVVGDRVRLLGEEHPDTLIGRANLAISYRRAGRTTDAIGIEEQAVADFARLLGEEHPHTLTVRANLAASYRQAGRATDAITIMEQVAADSARLLGEEHPDTLTTVAALQEWR